MKMEDREIRQGKISGDQEKIDALKRRISDESYLDHAISKTCHWIYLTILPSVN
jgi:hypothetical protein